MKRYFALILSVIVILTCFTACKPKIKNGAVIQNGAGEDVAVVTSPDGGVVRDGAGNLIVLVTDENGKNVKDENGEYKTNAVNMDHAFIVGKRVEAKYYSVEIPNGWSNAYTLNDLSITKDGSDESLVIMVKEEGSATKAMEAIAPVIDSAKRMYANTVYENTTVKINDNITANFVSVYIPNQKTDESGNPIPAYLGFYFFEAAGHTYSCKIEGRRNLSENLNEFTNILSSIKFH